MLMISTENQSTFQYLKLFHYQNRIPIALILFFFTLPAFGHNSVLPEVSVKTISATSLIVVIETHIAAFTLREPFGPLSRKASDHLKKLSPAELHDYVSGASTYLLTRSHILIGDNTLAPSNIRYPSPQAIVKHSETPFVDQPALPITLFFDGTALNAGNELRLLLPPLLQEYRLSVISGDKVQSVQFVKAGEPSDLLRLNVERSWWLRLTANTKQGILHVIPKGWDHMLFIIALALGFPYFWPVLLQASMFTLAHSVSLSLAVLGYLTFPVAPIEIIIALSISAMALGNLLHKQQVKDTKKVSYWRLLLIFSFGLIHGLGFASSFANLDMVPGSLWTALVGFNLGVEIAQIGVLAATLLLCLWLRKRYFDLVTNISCGLIMIIGLYWAIQRGGIIA